MCGRYCFDRVWLKVKSKCQQIDRGGQMGGIGVSVGINFSYRIMEVCTTDNSQCRISISSTPSFGGARSSRIFFWSRWFSSQQDDCQVWNEKWVAAVLYYQKLPLLLVYTTYSIGKGHSSEIRCLCWMKLSNKMLLFSFPKIW